MSHELVIAFYSWLVPSINKLVNSCILDLHHDRSRSDIRDIVLCTWGKFKTWFCHQDQPFFHQEEGKQLPESAILYVYCPSCTVKAASKQGPQIIRSKEVSLRTVMHCMTVLCVSTTSTSNSWIFTSIVCKSQVQVAFFLSCICNVSQMIIIM